MAEGGADERLVVMLEARIKDFERNMQAAERRGTRTYQGLRNSSRGATDAMQRDMIASTSRINQALASVSGQIGTFGRAFVGGLIGGAVTAAFAGFTSNVRGVIAEIADMADAAERIGIGTRDFQGLTAGLKLAGVETATSTAALEMFNQKLSEAAEGGGTLAQRLRENGISLKDSEGNLRSTVDILRDYADLLKAAPDQITRTGLATDAFGRSGKALSAAFSEGSDGITQMIRDAEDAGLVLDDTLVQKAAEIDDKWDILTMRFSVFFKGLAVGAADGVVQLAELGAAIDEVANAQARVETGSPFLSEQDLLILEAIGQATPEAAAELAALSREANALAEDTSALSAELLDAAANLRLIGNEGAADALFQAANEMQGLVAQLRDGAITTEEFLAQLTQVQGAAGEAASGIATIDGVSLDNVVARIAALGQNILNLVTAASAADSAILSIGTGAAGVSDMEADARGRNPQGSPIFSPTGDVPAVRPRRPGVDSFGDAPGGSGRGGGGGTGRIDALLRDLQTEREIVEEWYAESLDLLNEATDAQLAAYGGRNEAIERLEMEHQERLRGIRGEGQYQQLSETGDFFGALADVTATGGARLNKITKTLGAAEALINTYIAQSQVLKDPTLGFYGKLAAYAAIGAAGLRVVGALGGGGSAGSSRGAGRGRAGEAAETTAPAAEQSRPVQVSIRLDKNGFYQGQQIIDMTDAIQKELKARGVVLSYV
jgi:hypothetical protein